MGKHIRAKDHPLKASPAPRPADVNPAGGGRVSSTRPRPTGTTQPTGPDAKPVEESRRSAEVTDELVATRAYELWLEKGQPEGRDVENWTEAERELRLQLSAPHTSTTPLIAEV